MLCMKCKSLVLIGCHDGHLCGTLSPISGSKLKLRTEMVKDRYTSTYSTNGRNWESKAKERLCPATVDGIS